MYTLYFDGLFRAAKEPSTGLEAGVMCYGCVVYKGRTIVAHGHGAAAHSSSATSNVAEYLVLVADLEALQDFQIGENEQIDILGDSRTVIDQMSSECGMRTPNTRSLFNKTGKLANSLPIRNLRWISRDYNKDADVLTRRALLQVSGDSEKYDQTIRQIDPHEKNGNDQRRGFISPLDLQAIQPVMA